RVTIFIALPPRQPTTTLFPYTTLFRSPPARRARSLERAREEGGEVTEVTGDDQAQLGVDRGASGERREETVHVLPGIELADIQKDRKSTRLNSSHVAISYAVFCLKKKK